ncbi:MAG TPA: ABC transporter permease [Phycisphaerales bacterium]|nr:ABC transporter permease [Phycisphaerales bacterium]HMP36803.1 ABC transporter permease [Phycisphaerales bacterium]
MTDFSIVIRSLFARRTLTLLTVATVAVAAGLMLVLLTLRDAGADAFRRGPGTTHLYVAAEPSPLTAVLNGIFYANPPRNAMPWAKYRQIAESFPWEWAIPTQLGDSYRGMPVVATTRDFLTRFQPDLSGRWRFAEGRPFEANFEVVLGAEAARRSRLKLGDAIILTHGSPGSRGGDVEHHSHEHDEFPYLVVGILEPTGTPHDRALFTDLESSWILHAHDRRHHADPSVTMTALEDLLDEDRLITGIMLRLPTRPGSNVSPAMQQQFDALRRDTSIAVAQPEQQIDRLFAIVGSIDRLFIALAATTLVGGAISILLVMTGAMELRRRQIAVLRVLGFSRPRIFSLVVTESAVIGLLGAAAGVVLGVLGMVIASEALRSTLGLVIPAEPRLPWILIVSACTVALAALAGIAPALTAYRQPVAGGLRGVD